MGAWLALCVACGSTIAKPTLTDTAGGGAEGGGSRESGGVGGDEDVAQGAGTDNGPTAGTIGEGTGGMGAAGDAHAAGTPGRGGAAAAGGAAGAADAAGAGGAAGAAGSAGVTCRPALPVTFRDFKPYGTAGGHDDFEASARGVKNNDGSTFQGWNDIGCGLIEPMLAMDRKPRAFAGLPDVLQGVVLPGIVGRQRRLVSGPGCLSAASPGAGNCNVASCRAWDITPPTYSIKSGSTFDQWFSTLDGINIEVFGELVLNETAGGSGRWSFDSDAFFPLDGAGFGNSPGLPHNYSFTTEAHVSFTYLPGQAISFRGDDDLWIFVNGALALDMGGQHQPLGAIVDLDAQAAVLGIVPGRAYRLDLFHAERQSPISTFHFSTNIACFEAG